LRQAKALRMLTEMEAMPTDYDATRKQMIGLKLHLDVFLILRLMIRLYAFSIDLSFGEVQERLKNIDDAREAAMRLG
jgi:hypothetical protein